MTVDLIRSSGTRAAVRKTIPFKEVIVLCGTQLAWCNTGGECPTWRVACATIVAPAHIVAAVKIVELCSVEMIHCGAAQIWMVVVSGKARGK